MGSSSAESFLSLARTDETFSIFLGFIMLLIAGISRVDFMRNDIFCGSRGLWSQLEYMFGVRKKQLTFDTGGLLLFES